MRNKKITTTYLTVFLGGLFLASFWYLVYGKIYAKHNAILEMRKVILSNNKKEASAESLIKLSESLKYQKMKIDLAFIGEKDLVKLIEGIESLGVKSGVSLKINSLAVGTGKTASPSLSIATKGTFRQVFSFLYFLENMPYFVTVNKAAMKNINESEKDAKIKEPQWQGSFDINIIGYENS